MIESVALFTGVALFLYCMLGGADFGAGILELFAAREYRNRYRKIINEAMGPVWEANHVWLILAVVICFTAFPKVFSQVSITFHIPILLMLVGIVFRGCGFTFRHFDVYKDKSHAIFSWVFAVSSILAPFCMGLIAGGILLGQINPLATDFFMAF